MILGQSSGMPEKKIKQHWMIALSRYFTRSVTPTLPPSKDNMAWGFRRIFGGWKEADNKGEKGEYEYEFAVEYIILSLKECDSTLINLLPPENDVPPLFLSSSYFPLFSPLSFSLFLMLHTI